MNYGPILAQPSKFKANTATSLERIFEISHLLLTFLRDKLFKETNFAQEEGASKPCLALFALRYGSERLYEYLIKRKRKIQRYFYHIKRNSRFTVSHEIRKRFIRQKMNKQNDIHFLNH